MGWFSKIVKGVKNVVNKVTKVVKNVVKGIANVGEKIWDGAKKAVKGVSKAINKLGPLASIAIGFIPGFQGMWASAGIWGAVGKGALTGFITSGGKVKGALIGAVGGGIGYAANAGIGAYNKGVSTLGENATISEKISAGFKSVGNTTTEGFTNMYNSASDIVSKGDLGYANYLDASGTSVYSKGYEGYRTGVGTGESIYNAANEANMKQIKSGLSDYDKQYMAANKDTFARYDSKTMDEVLNYAKKTGENLETSHMLWEQTGGVDLDQSFDYTQMRDGTYKYTGEGLQDTLSSMDYSSKAKANKDNKSKDVSKVIDSLLTSGSSNNSPYEIPFSSADIGDNYNAAGGILGMSGSTGTALDFAQSYGGVLGGSAYAEQQAKLLNKRYNIA